MSLINKYSYFLLALTMILVSCEYEEENFNFDNALSSYVDMASSGGSFTIDTTMSNGAVVALVDSVATPLGDLGITSTETVRLRTARTSDTNVTVNVSGDINETINVVIPSGTLTADFSVSIPFESVLAGSATATISGVDSGLSIGRTVPSGADPLDNVSASLTWGAE